MNIAHFIAQYSDQINGLYEFGGACFSLMHIRALRRDRNLSGVSWIPFVYFASWGVWNTLFYPINGLWWSFLGGLAIVLVNMAWLGLVGIIKMFPQRGDFTEILKFSEDEVAAMFDWENLARCTREPMHGGPCNGYPKIGCHFETFDNGHTVVFPIATPYKGNELAICP